MRFEEQKPVQVVKPPMRDATVYTNEPTYDRSLFIRIFCPDGLQDISKIRCTLTCNGQIYKTGILDAPEGEEEVVISLFLFDLFNLKKTFNCLSKDITYTLVFLQHCEILLLPMLLALY